MNDREKQDILKGHQAQTVLNDPILSQAFNDCRAEIRETLFRTIPEQTQIREGAFFMDAALTAVEKKLIGYINRARGIEALQEEENAADNE